MVAHGNLHEGLAADPVQEVEDTLLFRPGLRIGRIVSSGQASPPGFWYDQAEDEFVLLVTGEAGLHLEGEDTPRLLRPGDWIHLPAHCRHRVAWTRAEPPTLWFVIHHAPAGQERPTSS